jgi:predicted hydrocarbon binding protein
MSLKAKTAPRRRDNRVMPFVFNQGGSIFHIVAEISDEPGSFRMLLQHLEKKVNLVATTSYSANGLAVVNCFATPLEPAERLSGIEALVSRVPSVRAFQVWEGEDGLAIDRFRTGLSSNTGERFTLFPVTGLAKVFEKITLALGSGGSTLLYMEGLEFGTQRVKPFRPMVSAKKEKALEQLAAISTALGFGQATIAQEEKGKLRLTVENCPECSVPTNCGRTCWFTRGMFVGAVNVLLDGEFEAQETLCVLRGDGICEFELAPRHQS